MNEIREWDIKRIIIGIVSITALLGAGYAAKAYILDKQQIARSEQPQKEGEVAGEQDFGAAQEEEVKQKIDTIKRDVTNLKPEDIAEQEPVKKIVQELENLKSSTQHQVTEGAKDTVCDQAKKLFCQ